jgi:hypothetical protein
VFNGRRWEILKIVFVDFMDIEDDVVYKYEVIDRYIDLISCK